MNGGVRHEAAHAVVAWRSTLYDVQSITLTLEPHVQMVGGHKSWSLGMEDAVVHAVGPLAEDPAAYDDYARLLTAWLFTDTHMVMAACAQLGQRGERHGQEWWLRFVRDEALELLRECADDIDRLAAAPADRGVLDHDDLVAILGVQTPRNATDLRTPVPPDNHQGVSGVSLAVFLESVRGGLEVARRRYAAAVGTPRVLLSEPDDAMLARWDAEAVRELEHVDARLATR